MARHDRLDAGLLLALGACAAFVPIGYLSGDALFVADAAMAPRATINPNHLLLEPVARAWVGLLYPLFPAILPADLLGGLSIILGALSAGLFRLTVAPALTDHRLHANLSACAFLFASAFDRLWVSGEIHMIQMVPLVGMLGALLAWIRRGGGWVPMTIAGVCGALAVLCFISNVLVVGATVVSLALVVRARDGRLRDAIAFPVIAAAAVLLVTTALWLQEGRPSSSPWAWLGTYRGDPEMGRAAAAYGVRLTVSGVVEATLRAGFGLASALTDLSPLTGHLRQGLPFTAATVLHPAATLASWLLMALGTWRLWKTRNAATRFMAVSAVAVAAVLFAFGLAWDNSDDQFYFQITPWWAAAVSGALQTSSRTVMVALASALAINVHDLVSTYVAPDRMAALTILRRETADGLVIINGTDQPSVLMHAYKVVPEPERLVSLRAAIDSLPGEQAVASIEQRARAAMAAGNAVTTVDVLGADARRYPWPGLERRGLRQGEVEEALRGLGATAAPRDTVLGAAVVRLEAPR